MPSLWKSGSASSRAKPGHRSIRGTISGPIPIPSALDDEEEFPTRTPDVGTKSAMISDDEFPIRTPGAGIASPVPPGELDTTPEEEPVKIELLKEQALHPPPPRTPESESEEEQVQVHLVPIEEPSPEGTRTEAAAQNLAPEAPSYPAPEPPASANAITSAIRPASRTPPQRPSPQRSSPERVSPQRTSPLRAKTSPQARRITNPLPSSVRYSVVSEAPSKGSQNKDAPQRKKSTLRSALGRIFGRNKRKTTNGVPTSAPISEHDYEPLSSSHHISDPTALSRAKEMSPKRSASLPINEYDRPLRSHSIGPDDIMAIESARNSIQAEGVSASPAGARRRAATAGSSRLFYQPRIRDPEWGAGLSPRPASTHGRGSRLAGSGESHDPSEIGRAITSDSGNAGVIRRRSRSLSGLQDITGARPGTRRRSDEIRFWRESYDPGFMSPLSLNPQDDADLDDTGVVDISAPESPAVERPPKTPPQPFNFGPISNEMVGMKITQAVSIGTRISNLEARSRKLERVVDQLCHAVMGFRAPPDETTAPQIETPGQVTSYSGRPADHPQYVYTNAVPPTIPAIYQTVPAGAKNSRHRSNTQQSAETDSHSQASFGEAPTFVGSLHPPSTSVAQPRSPTTTTTPAISVDRPTSTSTVRGATSLPIMSQNSGTQDQYAELVAQLETERAARLVLEAQVKKLSERLNTLSTTMFAMVRDPAKSRSQERLTPSIGGSSPLMQPKTLAVPPQEPLPGQATKALSAFETDEEDERDDSGYKTHGGPDSIGMDDEKGGSVTEDDFQTPREERPPLSYGAFGEELRPDDDEDFAEDSGDGSGGDEHKRKKAARTLSLSQLTLGKKQQTQI